MADEMYLEIQNVPRVPERMLKDSPSNPFCDLADSLLQLSRDSLTLQSFNSVRVGSCGHNDESDDGSLRSGFLKSGV